MEKLNSKLKQRIEKFNKIKFKDSKGKRIILATLKPINQTVTKAC